MHKKQKLRTNKSGHGWAPQLDRQSRNTTRTVMPDEMDTNLTFIETYGLTNAGIVVAGKRWTPNGAWDVDPNVGSTSTPGLTEWASLYNYYRVIGYEYVIEFVNQETFPVNVYVSNTVTDPGSSGSLNKVYASNTFGQSCTLTPTSGGPCHHVFKQKIKMSQLVGNPVEYEDNFRGLSSSANPADLVYLGIGIQSADNAATFTAGKGVTILLRIKMKIRFSDRKLITT